MSLTPETLSAWEIKNVTTLNDVCRGRFILNKGKYNFPRVLNKIL